MISRSAVLVTAVLVGLAVFLQSTPSAAQEHSRPAEAGGRRAQGAARSVQNRPRANHGRIPEAPHAAGNPGEQRQAEHLPTGHVNDLPHVNHDQWFGREQANDTRFRMEKPYGNGRFAHVGPAFRHSVSRVDLHRRRFWFSNTSFEVALWDWPLCEDWCWDCGNDFVVYDDPDHPGWYLLYNVHTGVYVHVQHLGPGGAR